MLWFQSTKRWHDEKIFTENHWKQMVNVTYFGWKAVTLNRMIFTYFLWRHATIQQLDRELYMKIQSHKSIRANSKKKHTHNSRLPILLPPSLRTKRYVSMLASSHYLPFLLVAVVILLLLAIFCTVIVAVDVVCMTFYMKNALLFHLFTPICFFYLWWFAYVRDEFCLTLRQRETKG